MPFITPAQLCQLGRKCSHCDANAEWLDKLDEKAPAYCDEHFPYKGYESPELEEMHKELGETMLRIIEKNYAGKKD